MTDLMRPTPADLLPADVWAQLDPHAGRLPRRQSRRIVVAFVGLIVLMLVAGGVWRSGLLVPRVDTQDEAANFSWSAGGRSFAIDFPVVNDGQTTITVTSVGRSGPGLRLLPMTGLPTTLPPGSSDTIRLAYAVDDCAAVPSTDWPVPVVVKRWWGAQTVTVLPDPITVDAPDGTREYSGTDPYGHPWQAALAMTACSNTGG